MHVSISGLYLNLELITKDWKNSRILCIEVATSGTVGRVEYSAVLYNAQVHFAHLTFCGWKTRIHARPWSFRALWLCQCKPCPVLETSSVSIILVAGP
jgi:hypothetical protein